MTPRSDYKRTALFPGSFNPFTEGHLNIALRALKICDNLVIAVGINHEKKTGADDRVEKIRQIFADNPAVSVEEYTTLTAAFARKVNASFIIRGVRDTLDFESERRMAEANLRLFGIETVFIPALPQLAWISSSAVRELRAFGFDTDALVPDTTKN